jgi:hypothetical protein
LWPTPRIFAVANIAACGLEGFVEFARTIDRHNRIITSMKNPDGSFSDFSGDVGVALGITRIGNFVHLRMLLAKVLG